MWSPPRPAATPKNQGIPPPSLWVTIRAWGRVQRVITTRWIHHRPDGPMMATHTEELARRVAEPSYGSGSGTLISDTGSGHLQSSC
jgi:hypothetical protein